MPSDSPLPPEALRLLLPLRATLGVSWEDTRRGCARAPDPVLAAGNLSRLLEHRRGPAAILATPHLNHDLLFVLGASQYLTTVLLRLDTDWEAAFLADRQRPVRSVEAHRSDLHQLLSASTSHGEAALGLRRYRNREYLRIGIRDLLGLASLEETTRDLSYLAEASAQLAYERTRQELRELYGEAVRDADGRPIEFVVLGMGKLGAEELNFSSDIDLIYLYGGGAGMTTGGVKGQTEPRTFFTALARGLTRLLSDQIAGGRVFRVDLRLRADGMNGPIVNSLPNVLLYYESWGQTWERAALLKARPIAGDPDLGTRFLRDVEPFVFRRYLDFGTVEDLKAMKARIERGLSGSDRRNGNVKLGRGGIREVEFVAQVLQLIHAGKDRSVRDRNTLSTLDRLVAGKYLAGEDRDQLRDAYVFLRHTEHKLQVLQDRQTHTLPETEAGVRTLARRLQLSACYAPGLGRRGEEWADGARLAGGECDEVSLFKGALGSHTRAVHRIFRGLFHAREEAQPPAADGAVATLLQDVRDEHRTVSRLEKLGFRDPADSYRNLRRLHDGPPHAPASPKRRKILYDLGPLLFGEVSRAADPDRALSFMADLIESIGARSSFLSLLLENPSTLRTIVGLFGTSEYLSRIFLNHPELLDSLVRADLVQVRKDRRTMQLELDARLSSSSDLEDRLDILRRYRAEEFLRIGINDCYGLLDITETGTQLTDLAQTCLNGAYQTARAALLRKLDLPELPGRLVVVGMGKLGAGELNYNSDLDLIFLYESVESAALRTDMTPAEIFTKLAQRLISTLQVQTREGYVYKIDTRLRPSGRSGTLVSSLTAFQRYHVDSARLWERQALIKARVMAGDPSLVDQIEGLLARLAYAEPITSLDVAEIERLRGRIEHELAQETSGRYNIKTGRGGIVDIEFLVQMLQLRYSHRFPELRQRSTLPAADALHDCGILSNDEHAELTQGYRFLRSIENRLRIERDQPVEALENGGEQISALARRLGYTGTDAGTHLIADYRRRREAIRACYSRWFDRETGGRDDK